MALGFGGGFGSGNQGWGQANTPSWLDGVLQALGSNQQQTQNQTATQQPWTGNQYSGGMVQNQPERQKTWSIDEGGRVNYPGVVRTVAAKLPDGRVVRVPADNMGRPISQYDDLSKARDFGSGPDMGFGYGSTLTAIPKPLMNFQELPYNLRRLPFR